MKKPTFKDLLIFVLANKTNKTFKDKSIGQIAYELNEGIKNNTLYYAILNTGEIVGMVLAEIDTKSKVLFVTENLAMSIKTLKLLARKARENFKGYTLQAIRHDKHRIFNTDKLYNKLT